MLEELGLGEAPTPDDADVVVFNTCTIREKPDTKLAAYLGDAAARKRARPRPRDRRRRLLRRGAARADLRALSRGRRRVRPRLDRASRRLARRRRRWASRGAASASTTGRSRRRCRCTASGRFQAWVQVSMGCNSTCSYCIVPAVRGREQSRRPGEILAEVTQLAAEGVKEITLLGQNVNSWGRDLAPDIRTEFGELLRACDAVDGIERIRFTSPHPKDFREPVIAAIAECDAVCEHVHLPLQSGSSRVLKAMRRTYTRERYLALVERHARGDPGRRARDRHHRRLPGRDRGRLRARRSRSSRRSGSTAPSRSSTRRATAPRRRRCTTRCRTRSRSSAWSGSSSSTQRIARERNAARVGRVEQVLVEGPSRTDETLLRGRTRRNTTVNFAGDARGRASSSTSRSSTRPRRRCAGARQSPSPPVWQG